MKLALFVCDHPYKSPATDNIDYVELFTNLFGELTVFDVTKEEYPSNPADFDLIIITGSRHSCLETLPWINRLKQFVKQHDNSPIRFVGICFGHQIIALALGGSAIANPKGWEIGRISVELNKNGQTILGRESIAIQAIHKDQVVQLPPGFMNLGSTDMTTVQCMYKPRKYFTLQGHPELAAKQIHALIDIAVGAGVLASELASSLADMNLPLDSEWIADAIQNLLL